MYRSATRALGVILMGMSSVTSVPGAAAPRLAVSRNVPVKSAPVMGTAKEMLISPEASGMSGMLLMVGVAVMVAANAGAATAVFTVGSGESWMAMSKMPNAGATATVLVAPGVTGGAGAGVAPVTVVPGANGQNLIAALPARIW